MSETLLFFLRIGITGFGGPMAVLGMIEETWVREKKWIDAERFSQILAICKLLPGPVSTQLAIFLGLERGGRLLGALCGILFVLPSFLIVLAISAAYFSTSWFADAQMFFLGMQLSALVVVLIAAYSLWRPFRGDRFAYGVFAGGLGLMLIAPRWEPVFLLGFGFLSLWLSQRKTRSAPVIREAGSLLLICLALFWTCFHAGAFTFGTGLAVIPLLAHEVVEVHRWMSQSQFLDGIAFGQITPGPVVITSTFIGYRVAGFWGSLAATAGMFSPAFIIILGILPRFWRRLAGTPHLRAFARGAVPAVVGGILATSLKLAYPLLVSHPTGWIAILVTLGFLYGLKLPTWAVIPGAGAIYGVAAWIGNFT